MCLLTAARGTQLASMMRRASTATAAAVVVVVAFSTVADVHDGTSDI